VRYPFPLASAVDSGRRDKAGRIVDARIETPQAGAAKFRDPETTADGSLRAEVNFTGLATLWINTGTLCNIACVNCYIESGPKNDRLAYLTAAEVAAVLDRIEAKKMGTREIGFTGGEPFMNPEIVPMLADALDRGFDVLALTNAMKPMWRWKRALLDLKERHGARLVLRVSLDHHTKALHEQERGTDSFDKTMEGIAWLAANGFALHIAGRTRWGESEESLRRGYARLFAENGISIDAGNLRELVLFPEMDSEINLPEITQACWKTLGVLPDSMMCASARMLVKRKGARHPVVLACTLIPYDRAFELGATLEESFRPVKLNHPHCARFCVLGGGDCG
jgi:uncharacterized Fe-S cluster-containing radical SAM superfamily protein